MAHVVAHVEATRIFARISVSPRFIRKPHRARQPIRPQHDLRLDPHRELPGPQNRPIPMVDYGVQAIEELF